MIEITLPELERRIRRFEAGEVKLEALRRSGGQHGGEHEAVESNLKAFRKELEDMRHLQAQLIAGRPEA